MGWVLHDNNIVLKSGDDDCMVFTATFTAPSC